MCSSEAGTTEAAACTFEMSQVSGQVGAMHTRKESMPCASMKLHSVRYIYIYLPGISNKQNVAQACPPTDHGQMTFFQACMYLLV